MHTPIANLFFDMDGTICESKQVISPTLRDYLNGLGKNIFVISGASREQMEKQLVGLNCTILAQSGNDTPSWTHKLVRSECRAVYEHIAYVKRKYPKYFNKPYRELIQNRGGQITFSLTGHDAPIELKKSCDPTKLVREDILKTVPFSHETLQATIAGTTCIDYTRKDGNKGANLKEWIKDIPNSSCVYFGDCLEEGGNDNSVIGIMKTVAIDSPSSLLLTVNKVLL